MNKTSRNTPRIFIESGQRFHKLVVLSTDEHKPGRRVHCRCDCGVEKLVPILALTKGATKSCGCRRSEMLKIRNADPSFRPGFRHGLTKRQHYRRWRHMMARCYVEAHHAYQNYGGRGITVCEQWQDAKTYCDWMDQHMGPCPPGYTLDRTDNDRGYEPGNVRWASITEQNINRRPKRKCEPGCACRKHTWGRERKLREGR